MPLSHILKSEWRLKDELLPYITNLRVPQLSEAAAKRYTYSELVDKCLQNMCKGTKMEDISAWALLDNKLL